MSRTSLVDRAYLRNQSVGGPAAAIPYARYDVLAPQALTILAREVAGDEMRADLLRKDFNLTVTSGTASLTTSLTANEPMLLGSLWLAKITSADSTYPWQYLPDFASLALSRTPYGLIYFTVEGTGLQCTDTTGAISSLSTTATANASFVPLAASLSGILDLEEAAINVLVTLAIGAGQVEPAAT